MSKDMFSLDGKKAVVTGAGRGLGRAIALALAEWGADVALVARTAQALESVAVEVRALSRKAITEVADVTATERVAPMIEEVAARLGGIDILVNNAGVNVPQAALEVTSETWDRILDLNLKAAFFVAQAVARVMVAQGRGGRIINMSSQTGTVAIPKRAAYCASKAGLNLLTKVMAVEWAQYGILVNAVAPTFIETEMTRPVLADREFRAQALSKIVLRRVGVPEDVVGAVVYLASAASSLVTGHVLLVDGGWTAH